MVTFELALEEQSPTPRAPPTASPWAQAYWLVVFGAPIETPPPLRDTLEPVPAMMEPLVEAALNTQLTPIRTATPTLGVVVAHAVGSLFASCCWLAWIDRLPAVNVVLAPR